MAHPATLSQLGMYFCQSPAHIRHHLKILERAGLVEFTVDLPLQNHLEKYYQAVEEAWFIHLPLLPDALDSQATLVIGSKDIATKQLTRYFRQTNTGLALQILSLNNMDGLVMLYQGLCQMSTCHLIEPGSGEYNRFYVRHIFPGQAMAIIRLYMREEGLIVAQGNPKRIRGLDDLARADIVMINREHGSGIRIWLDQALAEKGIPTENIRGYDATTLSHIGVAQAVQNGVADVGLGIAACACQVGLGFIHLFEEPYELVFPSNLLTAPCYVPFFDHLNSAEFRDAICTHEGYLIPANAGQVDILY